MTIVKTTTFKILILSENTGFRNILGSKLRHENFDVEFPSGGFHVLHLLEHHEYQMIIFNEDMTDMAAHEIILLVRQSKSKTELPILFISKSSNEEEIRDMILNGANDYIVQTSNYKSIIERAQKYSKNAA